MANKPPKLIAIDHDDYHAEFVGKTIGGKQFFLTTPFVPAIGGSEGCEFVALYVFALFVKCRFDAGVACRVISQQANKTHKMKRGRPRAAPIN